jgi:hypothetical protein
VLFFIRAEKTVVLAVLLVYIKVKLASYDAPKNLHKNIKQLVGHEFGILQDSCPLIFASLDF